MPLRSALDDSAFVINNVNTYCEWLFFLNSRMTNGTGMSNLSIDGETSGLCN